MLFNDFAEIEEALVAYEAELAFGDIEALVERLFAEIADDVLGPDDVFGSTDLNWVKG